MEVERLSLGDIAKDRITGYTGVVIARTEWLYGCVRVTLQSQELVKDKGIPVEQHTFDEPQIELVKAKKTKNVLSGGGPDRHEEHR